MKVLSIETDFKREWERWQELKRKQEMVEISEMKKSFARLLKFSIIGLAVLILIFILTCTQTGSPMSRGILINDTGSSIAGTDTDGLIVRSFETPSICVTHKFVTLNVFEIDGLNGTTVNLEDCFPMWIIIKWALFHEERYPIEGGSWGEVLINIRGKYLEVMMYNWKDFVHAFLLYIVIRILGSSAFLDILVIKKDVIVTPCFILFLFGGFVMQQGFMLKMEEQPFKIRQWLMLHRGEQFGGNSSNCTSIILNVEYNSTLDPAY